MNIDTIRPWLGKSVEVSIGTIPGHPRKTFTGTLEQEDLSLYGHAVFAVHKTVHLNTKMAIVHRKPFRTELDFRKILQVIPNFTTLSIP